MTGLEFRENHGDPADWDDTEYELFQNCATPGDPAPAIELLARLRSTTDDYQPAA